MLRVKPIDIKLEIHLYLRLASYEFPSYQGHS
jgi:hypothetical protein